MPDSLRLDELETRYTLLEQSYQELNDVVTQQWRLIDAQTLRIKRLEASVENAEQGQPIDSPPPHY
jgi:uncharacterized coiled-coil protein SlyX